MGLLAFIKSIVRPKYGTNRPKDIATLMVQFDSIVNEPPREWTDEVEREVQEAIDLYKKGHAHDERDEVDAAIECYSKAIELHPLFMEALDNRGLRYLEQMKFELAIPDFERSAQIEPESPLAFVALIECYRKTGQSQKAYRTIRYCIHKWPDKSPFPDWNQKYASTR